MRRPLVLFALALSACGSSPEAPGSPLEPQPAAPDLAGGCFALQLTGRPSPDVSLPGLIELSDDPAPGFITPGPLAVREPDAPSPLAPVSWWTPRGPTELELVLGGGYTGYSFLLQATPDGAWIGEGTYCADFGVAPTPPPLTLQLIPTSCP
jgi:hypothetical protein